MLDDEEEEEVSVAMSKEELAEKKREAERLEAEVSKVDNELRQRSKFVLQLGVQVKDKEREVNKKTKELGTLNAQIHQLVVNIQEMEEGSDLLRTEISQVDEEASLAAQREAAAAQNVLSGLSAAVEQAEEEPESSSLLTPGEDEYALKPVKEGLVEVMHLNSSCLFYMPEMHRFGDLLIDSIKYWNLPIEKVGLEDDEGRVWVQSALCRAELNLSERFKGGKIPQVYLRFKELEEEEEEEDSNWMTKKKKEAIEVVEEIDAAEVMRQEEIERLRTQAQGELLFFLIFVLSFVVVTLSWRDTGAAYQVAHAVRTSALDEDFPETVTHFQKSFHDVANSDEMWTYMNEIFVPAVNLGSADQMGGVISEYNRIIGTIRLRQLRVGNDKDCLVPAKYDLYPELGCYAVYSTLSNSYAPYGPDHMYQADQGNSMTKSVSGKLASYPPGGFTLDFPLEHHNFSKAVLELEANEWVDKATRVVFIEMITYNVNFNMFSCIQIIFEFSAGGLAYPWSRILPLTLTVEQPFWTGAFTAVMKFLYYVYLLYFAKRFYDEFKAARNSTDPPSCCNFWTSGWNWHEVLILLLAFVTILLTILYQLDPMRDTLDIASTIEWQDLFPMAEYAEMIIQLNAILALLIFWKIFKYLNLSSRFLALSNTLTTAFPEVFVFLIMFGIVFIAYGIMANLLFGTALVQYSSFARTMITLFLVTLGDFDYSELENVTKIFAPIFFFSFIIFVFFVLLNMFIGIINEAYNVESQKPKVTAPILCYA